MDTRGQRLRLIRTHLLCCAEKRGGYDSYNWMYQVVSGTTETCWMLLESEAGLEFSQRKRP